MYSLKPGLVIGFHGCEESIRNDIVSGKTSMKPSENAHDWFANIMVLPSSNFNSFRLWTINLLVLHEEEK